MTNAPKIAETSPCTSCGACCAYSEEWPRFSTEPDSVLDRIPAELVDPSLSRMAWKNGRCAALSGELKCAVSCTIYDIRPDVCRACQPGDEECSVARAHHGLEPLDHSETNIRTI